MKEKQVFDYYFEGTFLFRIGKVNYRHAQMPLKSHTHQDCMEFVFMIIISSSAFLHCAKNILFVCHRKEKPFLKRFAIVKIVPGGH